MTKRAGEQKPAKTFLTSRRGFLGGAATAAASALLAQAGAGSAGAADATPLRAAVLEHRDQWTNGTGLAELLTKAGFAVVPLDTAKAADEQGVDVIAFGGFTNNAPAYGAYIAAQTASIQTFVSGGGVVLDMAQSDQFHSTVSYLPGAMTASRNDSDYDTIFPVAVDHPLITHLRVVDGKVFTGRSTQIRVSWESLLGWSNMRVLLACQSTGRPPALLEGAHGRGRFIITSLTIDKVYNAAGQTIQPAAAVADSEMFFTAFASYVRQVIAGTAPEVTPTMQPIAGPLVGDTGTEHSRVLIRPGSDLHDRPEWTLDYWSEGTERRHVRAALSPENDHTVLFDIGGLTAATKYSYSIAPDGDRIPGLNISGSFSTATENDAPTKLVVGLGSCVWTETNHIWDTIRAEGCEAFVMMGDTPYIDSTNLQTARDKHRAFLQQPQVREVTRSMPVWGTWDDHDFGGNDVHGDLPGKRNNRRAFVDYRAHSSYGHTAGGEPLRERTEAGEGIYTSFRRGPLEVFLVDPRWFSRTETSWADSGKQTAIGQVQWDWLQEKLLASSAPFKCIATGMIWDDKMNGESDDWGTYAHEREAIFDFVQEHRIDGVFLLGGDIHVSRALNYGPRVGYDLWQFIVSPMHSSIIPSLNVPNPALVHSAAEPHVFMRLELDTTVEPSTMTATWINRDGERLFEVKTDTVQLTPQPALVQVASAGTELLPGESTTVTTSVANQSGGKLRQVVAGLEVPDGWRAVASTEDKLGTLDDGESRTVNWIVEPPIGHAAGPASITAHASYKFSGRKGSVSRTAPVAVLAEGVVPRSRVAIAAVSSEDVASGDLAANVLDGNPSSHWHSRWSTDAAGYPHWIVLDMGSEHLLDGLGHLPRQDGATNGMIKDYEIQLSEDNVSWGAPVATGSLPAGTALTTIEFPETRARYLKLVALSSQNGARFGGAAELTPLGRAVNADRPAALVTVSSAAERNKMILSVNVLNQEAVAVDVKIRTDYGKKTLRGIRPGRSAFHDFTVRRSDLPAGLVEVEVTGRVSGAVATNTIGVLYQEG
ncbi:hypothetical protein M2317_001516 [Microbacterium sp. ZKA21]|uniref:alkaline phosphatase D family protein n=1 Tax=Microbacterium sp. ZKA21 TaxID=3381694 RepID=UPI003D20DDF7